MSNGFTKSTASDEKLDAVLAHMAHQYRRHNLDLKAHLQQQADDIVNVIYKSERDMQNYHALMSKVERITEQLEMVALFETALNEGSVTLTYPEGEI